MAAALTLWVRAGQLTSQHGQDHFVLEMLNGLRGGFFLDSGASNGVRSSNTHLLEYAFGWTGICVEPNDLFYAELARNRRCRLLNCCLYDCDGEVEFLEQADTMGGILDEYDPAQLQLMRELHCMVTASPPCASPRAPCAACYANAGRRA
jgi:hypothetical protein